MRFGEVEAGLSLGFTERDSRLQILSRSFEDALMPNIDQARTTGLVTLPGTFVGVLLATGSAIQAASVQVLILISLMLAQTCGVAVTAELVARGRISRDRNIQLVH
jgi:putative ABC transport system permease protein